MLGRLPATTTSGYLIRPRNRLGCGRCLWMGAGLGGGLRGRSWLGVSGMLGLLGFGGLVLMATLPGVPLYRAYGFRDVAATTIRFPDGVTVGGVSMEYSLG